ncbi:MAG: YjbQ family protein [Firmicutes bacterium]|nr:YjbQ family protein [Bacillota bacterium]
MRELTIETRARTELRDITSLVSDIVVKSGIKDGICVVFVPHTTAGVTINERADPDVQKDILAQFARVVPFDAGYSHMEGNSAAHIKSSIVGASETILIENGRLVLGTWQGIYLCEFDGPRLRKVLVKVLGK